MSRAFVQLSGLLVTPRAQKLRHRCPPPRLRLPVCPPPNGEFEQCFAPLPLDTRLAIFPHSCLSCPRPSHHKRPPVLFLPRSARVAQYRSFRHLSGFLASPLTITFSSSTCAISASSSEIVLFLIPHSQAVGKSSLSDAGRVGTAVIRNLFKAHVAISCLQSVLERHLHS